MKLLPYGDGYAIQSTFTGRFMKLESDGTFSAVEPEPDDQSMTKFKLEVPVTRSYVTAVVSTTKNSETSGALGIQFQKVGGGKWTPEVQFAPAGSLSKGSTHRLIFPGSPSALLAWLVWLQCV